MAVYWLLFFIPAIAVFAPWRLDAHASRLVWVLTGLFFTVIMGLRYQVGGDWYNYLLGYDIISHLPLLYALAFKDPGYSLLNWIVFKLGGSIYWINLFCASILMCGTVAFCRAQPRPWLALLVAVPYMLIVVGMGYTRQATALGFAMLGLVALGNSRVLSFVILVGLGSFFHKSAALLVPIAAFAGGGGRLWKGMWVLVAAVIIYRWVLADSADALWQNYVTADMESYGAGIRVAMNSVPALIFFVFRRRLNPGGTNDGLWMIIAVLSLACIPLVASSSTAVDRTALYFIPIQLYVFSRLPSLAATLRNRSIIVLAITAYYAAVQWTWLNLAIHARYWVPYHFAPLS